MNTHRKLSQRAITPSGKTFGFVCSNSEKAIKAHKNLIKTYGETDPTCADIIVAIGGDGFMLETLDKYGAEGTPIFGMNRGTVGFLMNGYQVKELAQRLDKAVPIKLHRLQMRATTVTGDVYKSKAINEVALLRETRQAAHLKISVDEVERLDCLICDGILLATPAGSTAYNLSAHGPIIPLSANLHALTPISAFRPRRWRGALLPESAKVCFEVLNPEKRPVSATADGFEVRDVAKVEVEIDKKQSLNLLFDHDHQLEERILREQFIP
ncbi:MAG: NAD kinase [Alphaproteobacteria bacterium]